MGSSLEDTAHRVHSSLTESCVQPERRRGARWSLSPLTWSVNFFSRAWSRLRASSNWPPSCWLARPLTRPPGRDASSHQGAHCPCVLSRPTVETAEKAAPVRSGERHHLPAGERQVHVNSPRLFPSVPT